MTIMIFCAHPDDEAIGPGGTIAKYAKEGEKVIVVIFTQGEGSHPWKKRHIIRKTRREEAKKCAKILGVHELVHMALTDGKLTKDCKKPIVTETLLQLLKKHEPSKIFTHSQDDFLYPDHVAVNKVTLDAVDRYNLHAKNETEAYTFTIWGTTWRNRNNPQLYIDISATFEIKQRAISVFKSQGVALFQLWPTILYKAMVNASPKSKYAETFYKIR